MDNAFQADAFQNDAFQVFLSGTTVADASCGGTVSATDAALFSVSVTETLLFGSTASDEGSPG